MTDKAYIVVNEQQECEVLNKLYSQGKKWNQLDNYVIPRKQYYVSLPYVIYEYGYSNYLKFGRVPKIKYSTEIVFDGRKEEHMSEKYVVSQVFMNELKDWKHDLILEDAFFVNQEAINNMPKIIKNWWVDDYETIGESNKRLISIIRYMSGANDFEVEKPKKWVVRSKECNEQGNYLYIYLIDGNGVKDVMTGWTKDIATKFGTKEEAESWANAHQEVVQVEVEA